MRLHETERSPQITEREQRRGGALSEPALERRKLGESGPPSQRRPVVTYRRSIRGECLERFDVPPRQPGALAVYPALEFLGVVTKVKAIDKRAGVDGDRVLEMLRGEPLFEVDQVACEGRQPYTKLRGAGDDAGAELATQDVQR